MEELSIAQAYFDLPMDMRERLDRGERAAVPELEGEDEDAGRG